MIPSRTIRTLVAVSGATLLAGSAACRASSAAESHTTTLTVLAAASLNHVFPTVAAAFTRAHPTTRVRFSFAGTDALVLQIEQGIPADLFGGASAKYGDQLAGENLVEPPKPFATNRLALILPSSNPAGLRSPRDLARPGIKLVVGADTVPIGRYTRKVLANLDGLYGPWFSRAALANVVSDEDNVEGVLTKVRLGEADAGFVYVTDARAAAGDAVRAMQLPEQAQAIATYPIAVVRASSHRALARQFEGFVLGPEGQRALAAAGFGPPSASG
jgi:molybdate transport system substrate-binding protein